MPATAKMSSTHSSWAATKCIDGNKDSGCHSQKEKVPWVAIDYGGSVKIRGVVIIPRPGQEHRARNLEVRVADEMPVAGQLFTGGQRLGTSKEQVPRDWNIEITSESGSQLLGRYLVVQNNFEPIWGGGEYFNYHEFTAWGKGKRFNKQ